jgi:hypothetical protein
MHIGSPYGQLIFELLNKKWNNRDPARIIPVAEVRGIYPNTCINIQNIVFFALRKQ